MSALAERLARIDHFLLVARLSLLLVVVNANESPVAFVAATVACAVMFLQPTLLRMPWPWLGLSVILGTSQVLEWWSVDDHIVVTTYWVLAIGLSRLADRGDRVLAVSGRLLIGLVFAFAFGWKLLSSQYLSVDFFRYEFLIDERFHHVAEIVGGTAPRDLDQNIDDLGQLYARGAANDSIDLVEGPRNHDVARLFTAWGLVIEGIVAAAFLLPLSRRLDWLRPASVFAFSYTTYVVVPVAGFAALLMVLVLAHRDTPRLRAALVGSFAVLLAWGGIFPLLT